MRIARPWRATLTALATSLALFGCKPASRTDRPIPPVAAAQPLPLYVDAAYESGPATVGSTADFRGYTSYREHVYKTDNCKPIGARDDTTEERKFLSDVEDLVRKASPGKELLEMAAKNKLAVCMYDNKGNTLANTSYPDATIILGRGLPTLKNGDLLTPEQLAALAATPASDYDVKVARTAFIFTHELDHAWRFGHTGYVDGLYVRTGNRRYFYGFSETDSLVNNYLREAVADYSATQWALTLAKGGNPLPLSVGLIDRSVHPVVKAANAKGGALDQDDYMGGFFAKGGRATSWSLGGNERRAHMVTNGNDLYALRRYTLTPVAPPSSGLGVDRPLNVSTQLILGAFQHAKLYDLAARLPTDRARTSGENALADMVRAVGPAECERLDLNDVQRPARPAKGGAPVAGVSPGHNQVVCFNGTDKAGKQLYLSYTVEAPVAAPFGPIRCTLKAGALDRDAEKRCPITVSYMAARDGKPPKIG